MGGKRHAGETFRYVGNGPRGSGNGSERLIQRGESSPKPAERSPERSESSPVPGERSPDPAERSPLRGGRSPEPAENSLDRGERSPEPGETFLVEGLLRRAGGDGTGQSVNGSVDVLVRICVTITPRRGKPPRDALRDGKMFGTEPTDHVPFGIRLDSHGR